MCCLARIDAGEVCSRRAVGLWAGVREGLLVWDKIFPTAVQSPGGEVSSLESDVWKVGLWLHSVASKSGGSE